MGNNNEVNDIWLIEHTSHGWYSRFGTRITKPAPNADYTVTQFHEYESARHDTKNQAIKYAALGGMTGKNRGLIYGV